MGTNWQLSPFTLLLICTGLIIIRAEEEQHDVREGADIQLRCRFSLDPSAGELLTYYWVRNSASGHENVAIEKTPLETNYKISYAPEEGRYDLMISNVTYERDNGTFKCRVKAGGSGRTLHSQSYALVVLTQPSAPILVPGSHAKAQEGKEIKLTCSSSGGSPKPSIMWYRNETAFPLETVVVHGKTRAEASIATLKVIPNKEDDGALFRCVVWNRAMHEDNQLEAAVELSVDYFPRVNVAPGNPLQVEIDGTATMECIVDAKPPVNSVRWSRNGKNISTSFIHTIKGVTTDDAGKYTCSADNGLEVSGENDIVLDVLYPPRVIVPSKTHDVEEGGNVEIQCEVSANPEPTVIEWTMEDHPKFRQKGNTLLLHKVTADMAGTYVCRAMNVMTFKDGKSVERSNSASIAVLVRHKPGRARITPDRPVAQEGTRITLSCMAKPSGWPVPQYRWYRDLENPNSKPAQALTTGNKITIPSVHLGSEGVYYCQATNELGHGEMAAVTLEVYQPPRFQSKLQPHLTKRSGETDFSVSCSAIGKPRPNIKWYKDNVEIISDSDLYKIATDATEERNAVNNVKSTLQFYGSARPNTNKILPEDRGTYSCTFENEVKKVESTMYFRVEHEPIAVKLQSKFAYDLLENAELKCRVQAYPKPEYQWFFGSYSAPLQMSSKGHYEIITNTYNNDSYLSVLKIKAVSPQDYGDYYCNARNTLGSIRPQIRLQPKGAPESPRALISQSVGPTHVTLKWEAGFDGGITSTKYFVRYRRVGPRPGDGLAMGEASSDCASAISNSEWMEYDCGQANPCNVTGVEQHNTYKFKVKAVNTKGQSNYSNEIEVLTKVNKILPPEQLTYDPSVKTMAFSVSPTCLALVGVAEGLGDITGSGSWQVVDTIPLKVSGSTSTFQEAVLEMPNRPNRKGSAAHGGLPLDDPSPRIRLKLCLQFNQDICSDYTEADIGPAYEKKESDMVMTSLFTTVIAVVVIIIIACLLYMYCRSKRNGSKEVRNKDHELDSMKSAMDSMKSPNQSPPPYTYASTGMENKALEHSMDLAIAIDDSKNTVYAAQGGYAYRPSQMQGHPGQNNPDWTYADNYANSNNGGSVNSQDSVWQMKMASNAGMPGHHLLERQSNFEYDPIAHGGYSTMEEYAPYQRLPHVSPPAEYMRATNIPSRQDYCSDPYASIHKPKKRIDPHMESPYHEVSGLPEAYEAGPGGDVADEKPAHLSLSYDESLESGYSTPNSRSRRVIREIIV